jgi:hypothetical protein
VFLDIDIIVTIAKRNLAIIKDDFVAFGIDLPRSGGGEEESARMHDVVILEHNCILVSAERNFCDAVFLLGTRKCRLG